MREELGIVTGSRRAGKDTVVLTVEAPMARDVRPGEFVNVKVPCAGDDPLLRRPLSVSWAEPENGTFELLIQIRGRGTRALGDLPPGSRLSLLGPLGRGFPLAEMASRGAVDLVAGACGVAPLLFLAQELRRSSPILPLRLFLGARTRDVMPEPDVLERRFPGIRFATDDGTLGERGDVVSLFKGFAGREPAVGVCGPRGLLEAMRVLGVERGFPCYLSLEAAMACGFGVCKGCVVLLASGAYATVCRDGPVFEAQALASLAGPVGCAL